jgi:glycerate 2-kinase
MTNAIIISDLDGTLLDSLDYSCAAAGPALERVRMRRVPLVLCSSKTRAEIEVWRRRLENSDPFIAENGGAIYVPRGYFSFPFEAGESGDYQLIRFGLPYAEVRQHFVRLREQCGAKVRGFADMTDEQVAAMTGLARDEAVLARQREFDEVFVFDGAPDAGFLQAIEASGLYWTQGQFFHILGAHDKGGAVRSLQALYRREYGAVTSIGLGDSLNDLSLLQAVDRPVLVRHADGGFDQRIDVPGLLRTRLAGPAGWNEAVLQLLASGEPVPELPRRQDLLDIFDAALAAVDPYAAVLAALSVAHDRLQVAGASVDLAAYDRIIVVGAGKATARMALALESLLGGRIAAGLIVVKHGHTAQLSIIEQVEAAHPVPDEAGLAGAQRILQMVRAAGAKTLVICLLSGGASALLVAPVAGVTLQDKQRVTGLLLNAGASITELNAVRKHLSMVKGGRLAQAARPAQVLTLILSDVIGDPPGVIASGPTAADDSTFAEAWTAIEKYGLQEKIPAHVSAYLRRGMAGQEPETAKGSDPCFAAAHNIIVGGLRQALAAAETQARRLGYAAEIVSAELQGEARDAARFLAQAARDELAAMPAGARRCLLYGGETTVSVRGGGKGGRNQELALAFALEAEGTAGVSLLSAGTDGSDGPTDATGAMVDGETAAQARRFGMEPARYLEDNDSYSFFRRFDELSGAQRHLKTGPTGTNVMDIQIMLCARVIGHSGRNDG